MGEDGDGADLHILAAGVDAYMAAEERIEGRVQAIVRETVEGLDA